MSETTISDDVLTCPHCGHRDSADLHQIQPGGIEVCARCGKRYRVAWILVTTTYATDPVDDAALVDTEGQ